MSVDIISLQFGPHLMLERKWPSDKVVQTRQQPDMEREFIRLGDIVAFVRHYLITILTSVAACTLIAAAYVATTDPIYTAKTEVLIEPKLPEILQQQPSDVNLSLDTAQIESQIVVMQSEKIARMVIDQLGLVQDDQFSRSKTMAEQVKQVADLVLKSIGLGKDASQDIAEKPQPAVPAFERERRTMGALLADLDIRRAGVSYAIDIYFSSRNGEQAAVIANAIADAYVREQLETRAATTQRGLQWLEDRIGQLRNQMNSAAQAAQAFRAKHDYHIGENEIPDANASTFETRPQNNKGAATLEELEATADSYRKMYESFLQAFTTSVNQQPVADARIVTAATRPLAPSQPRRKLILAFGAIAGLMAGLTIAFLRRMLDRSIRSPRQIREEFGLDCIGKLPPVKGWRGGFGRFDEVVRSPMSAFSEGIRDIRAVVSMANLNRPIRLLGITSISPGEGKSTLAGNLAAACGSSGMRTLLIDADTVHSSLTRGFVSNACRPSVSNIPGRTGQIKLQIAPASGQPFDILSSLCVDAYDLLTASNMQALLGELDGYDMVVVDLPPFTSGNQGLIAASQLDGLIITAQWAKTPLDLMAEFVHSLQMTKTVIVGLVLTQMRDPSMRRLRRRANQSPR